MGKNIVPSERGKRKTPHCSSMMSLVKKIVDLTMIFFILEKCIIRLTSLIHSVGKLIQVILLIILIIKYLCSLSAL